MTPTITITTTVTPALTPTPTNALSNVDLDGKFTLAYPNPAENQVTFVFHLEQASTIQVQVFNVVGERVTMLEQAYQAGQAQTLVWDCGDVAAGIYLVRILKDGNLLETQKVAIVR